MQFRSFFFLVSLITYLNALIDPISLSAVGAAVLGYLGLSAAATGTLAALAGTGVVGVLKVVNDKLKEEGKPPISVDTELTALCFHDSVGWDKNVVERLHCSNFWKNYKTCSSKVNSHTWGLIGTKHQTCGVMTSKEGTTANQSAGGYRMSFKCVIRRKPLTEEQMNYVKGSYGACMDVFNKIENDSEKDI